MYGKEEKVRITMSKFKDKFHLTPEQSLFLAKKKWDENAYCGMKMENRAVTFQQTQTIVIHNTSYRNKPGYDN